MLASFPPQACQRYTRSSTRCCNDPRSSSPLLQTVSESIGRTKYQPSRTEWHKPRHQLHQSSRHSCSPLSRTQSTHLVASSRSHAMCQFAMRLEPANILPPYVTHIDYYPAITSTHCHVSVEKTREAYHEVDTFDDVNFTVMRPMRS